MIPPRFGESYPLIFIFAHWSDASPRMAWYAGPVRRIGLNAITILLVMVVMLPSLASYTAWWMPSASSNRISTCSLCAPCAPVAVAWPPSRYGGGVAFGVAVRADAERCFQQLAACHAARRRGQFSQKAVISFHR